MAESGRTTLASAGTDARSGLGISLRTPVKGVRKAVAASTARSSEISEATVGVDVDATALLELREGLKAGGAQVPGILAFIASVNVAPQLVERKNMPSRPYMPVPPCASLDRVRPRSRMSGWSGRFLLRTCWPC